MGHIDIEVGDLTYEILYTATIYADEGTYDTPPYYEWEFEIDEITRHGEYGNGQDVFFSELPEQHQDIIWDTIDNKIGESI